MLDIEAALSIRDRRVAAKTLRSVSRAIRNGLEDADKQVPGSGGPVHNALSGLALAIDNEAARLDV